MDETTFIDLQSTPEELPPLPSGVVNVNLLRDIVLGGLELAGATPEAVLTTFSPTPLLWPIPPRLWQVGQRWLQTRIGLGQSSGLLIDLHKSCRMTAHRQGVGDRVLSMLEEALSPKVAHPLLFTRSEKSAEAVDLFSLEYILAADGAKSRLRVQGDSVSRYWTGKREALSGLKLNNRISSNVTAEWVRRLAFGSRGTIVYGTFDVFDRCSIWADRNMSKPESATLRQALAWYKLHQDKRMAYDFEQLLMTLKPFEVAGNTEFGELLFTHEALDFARDLWLLSEKDDHEAFRDFYDYLVPTYLDDDQFRRMFKTGMVLKEDFTEDIRMCIDAGMMNFAGWFLKMMRKYDRK